MKSEIKKRSSKVKSLTVKKPLAKAKKKVTAKAKVAPPKTVKTPSSKAKTVKAKSAAALPALTKIAKTTVKRAVRVIKKIKAIADEPIAKTKTAVRSIRKAALEIPAILLEGDAPVAPTPSGPGRRYSLGPTPPHKNLPTEGDLPDAYGTKKLLLTARDPHWLYAYWDFTDEQLRGSNALSDDGHLVLRVYKNEIKSQPESQIHVHPESRNWFVHVAEAGCKYVAELGYYSGDEGWVRISASGATFTSTGIVANRTEVSSESESGGVNVAPEAEMRTQPSSPL